MSLILLFQLGFIVSRHELITQQKKPTYKQFYAEPFFNEVKKFIGRPLSNYRVISVGVHPSIAQYNGFNTLDGYFPISNKNYKQKFREVIAKELKKDSYLKYYYDNWGSRCYAFTCSLRPNYLNPKPPKIKALKKIEGYTSCRARKLIRYRAKKYNCSMFLNIMILMPELCFFINIFSLLM